MRAEIASIEAGLADHRNVIASAAGALVSRTPQFLSLIERIYTAYRDLRNCRLIVREIERLVHLDDHLVRLADNNQPSAGHRFGGYENDEAGIARWGEAAAGCSAMPIFPSALPSMVAIPAPQATAGTSKTLIVAHHIEGQRHHDGRRARLLLSAGVPSVTSGRAAKQRGCPSAAARRSPASAIRRLAGG